MCVWGARRRGQKDCKSNCIALDERCAGDFSLLWGTKWSLCHTRWQLRLYLERHGSLALHIVHRLPGELWNKKTASSQAQYSVVMTGRTMWFTRLSSQKENVFSQNNSA